MLLNRFLGMLYDSSSYKWQVGRAEKCLSLKKERWADQKGVGKGDKRGCG